jgi:hypothetical protein
MKNKTSKIFTAQEHVKDKYWAQYMGMMVKNLKDRGEEHMNEINMEMQIDLNAKHAKAEENFQDFYRLRERKQTYQKSKAYDHTTK